MSKKIYVLIGLALVLIVAISVYQMRKRGEVFVSPTIGPITESIYAIGTVKSYNTYSLKLGVIASVKEFFVKEGDVVSKGKSLLRTDLGSSFASPIEGVVSSIHYKLGETITPQSPILSIVDTHKLYIEASVEQQGALKILPLQAVKISFESLNNQIFEGKVKTILPRDNQFIVQIEVDNLPHSILPGMTADLSIEISQKNQAVLLPMSVISNGFIVVMKNGKKEKMKVKIGVSDSEMAEILEPQLAGDVQVLSPKTTKE